MSPNQMESRRNPSMFRKHRLIGGLVLIELLLTIPALVLLFGLIDLGGQYRAVLGAALLAISILAPFIYPLPAIIKSDDHDEE